MMNLKPKFVAALKDANSYDDEDDENSGDVLRPHGSYPITGASFLKN